MSDKWEHLRQLAPLGVLSSLGVDVSTFKKRSGKQEWYGRCPMPGHNPKHNTTSFSINQDGRFQCFGCSEKGRGSIDLTRAIRKVGFQDAVSFLEGLTVAPRPQNEPISDSGASDGQPDGVLKPLKSSYHKFTELCPWLEQRVPDQAIRERYGIFAYHNPARKSVYSHKIMIPVKGMDGEVYGYLARTPEPKEGESKYFFPKNFPKSQFVFGGWEMKGETHKLVYAGESSWMVMRFAMMGFPAVALYGWSASPEQIEILASLARGVYYLPDRNKSGPECAGVIQAIAKRLWVKAPPLPDGVDDAEYLSAEQIKAL